MQRIAKFEKVSLEQFTKDWMDCFPMYGELVEIAIAKIHENLKLPERKTRGSAGYDFHSPLDFTLNPGETIKIPTGIRAKMDEGWVL